MKHSRASSGIESRHAILQAEAKQDVPTMIALQPALKFNGGGDSRIKSYVLKGTVLPERHRIVYHCAERDTSVSLHAGHVNHSIFWENLTPPDVAHLCSLQSHTYLCIMQAQFVTDDPMGSTARYDTVRGLA